MYCIDLHKWKAKLRRVMVEEVEKKKKRDKEKEVKSGRRRTDIGGKSLLAFDYPLTDIRKGQGRSMCKSKATPQKSPA